MCPLKFKVYKSTDAGRVAHGGMVWREGPVLDQTILPPLGEQGQVLVTKGILERTPPKKATCWGKKTPQE